MLCCSVSCQDILEGSVHLKLFVPCNLTVTSGLFYQSLVLVGGEKLCVGQPNSLTHLLLKPVLERCKFFWRAVQKFSAMCCVC